jgi:two-component system, LytTR family, response regulator LytT
MNDMNSIFTILIIEDEIKSAKELIKTIEKSFPEAVILNTLQSIKASVKWFKENEAPNLIFSDIQLADGLSFEIFKQVTITTPIIFCTAFDEYAIEAFKTSSIDYLLKPIDDDKVVQSIEKYNQMKVFFEKENNQVNEKMKMLLAQLNKDYKRTILVHHQNVILPINVDSIAYIHHELGNSYIMTFDRNKYFISQNLDQFEAILNPHDFFRANRQFIINRKAVFNLENYCSRRLVARLNLPTAELIIVSKTKSPLLLKWLEIT